MLGGLKEFAHRHKKWEPLFFFSCGFIFDALLLHRIDDPLMLAHQALYLFLSGLLIAWDLFCEEGRKSPPAWLGKLWNFREGTLHFLLGTLLNVYTIFYFKSGSLTGSIYFLLLLALLLFLNEVRPSQIPKHFLRNALFGLCLISYLNILIAIAIGSIGTLVFLITLAIAYLLHSAFVAFIRKRLERPVPFREIRAPFLVILGLYAGLYFTKVLPPVPLSVKHIGIYHSVEREGEKFKLGYTRAWWRFWQSGDQSFAAREGDRVFCFIKIFSPTRFEGRLLIRWKNKDPKRGWQDWDAIPLTITGGREEGFRSYAVKTNFQPGPWIASVETEDGREVGRISFEITSADPNDPVEFRYDYH